MHKENKNELESLQVPSSLRKFTKELPQSYKEEEIPQERMDRVEREFADFRKRSSKQWNTGKKASVFTLAAAASIALFIGSGFVSPTMAEVISKIPPLSTLFQQIELEGNLVDQITMKLKEEGYPVKQISEHSNGSKGGFYIFLEASDQEVKEMKEDIQKSVKEILNQKKYNGTYIENFYVKVRKHKEPPAEWLAEQEKMDKEDTEIYEMVYPVLEKYDYKHSWGWGRGKIELDFPSVESKERIEEIKNAVSQVLKEAGKENIVVEHKLFNQEKRQQYDRWGNAISAIAHELKTYKKYKVSGVGYHSKDGTMRVLIKIKLPSTDPDAQDFADTLRTMIEEFIHTEEIWTVVKEDPYVIEITSKDGKLME